MKNNIFMPDKIRVGSQNRDGTYTGKLAYVIYYDEKGKLRKEKSWNSWRDHKIKPEDIVNEPIEGFVLNKKAGGYRSGWDHRQTMVRVYDPRGFEFEIDIENLLYILDNTSSVVGKGLEGKFVYGWDAGNLILISEKSPDYKELVEYNDKRKNQKKLVGKDMIIGATYQTKDNREVIYMGRFECFSRIYTRPHAYKSVKKKYVFADKDFNSYNGSADYHSGFETVASVGAKIIDCVTKVPHVDYAKMMDCLDGKALTSPYDPSKDELVPYTLEEFKTRILGEKREFSNNYGSDSSILVGGEHRRVYNARNYAPDDWRTSRDVRESERKRRANLHSLTEEIPTTNPRYEGQTDTVEIFCGTLDEIHEYCAPEYRKGYLKNGKPYKTGVFK